MYAASPRIGDLTHTPIIKIPLQWKRVLTFAPPEVVPLSPGERLGIAVARLGKGGSSQSGTTSSNPPSSGEESANFRSLSITRWPLPCISARKAQRCSVQRLQQGASRRIPFSP